MFSTINNNEKDLSFTLAGCYYGGRGDYVVENLRKLRTSRGISQQQLADVIGTSQQSINKYENHSVEPDIRTLTKIADYFGTTIDYLVGHVSRSSEGDPIDNIELSREEKMFAQDYRRLSKEEKESIRLVIKNYIKNKKSLEI